MRIRRSASRVLGSAYFTAQAEAPRPPPASELPPPPPPPSVAAAYGAVAGLGGPVVAPEGACELSLSPWDLPYELDDSNTQNLQEAPFDRYLVHIPRRASFVFTNKEDDTIEMKDKICKHEDDEVFKNQKPATNNSKEDGAAAKKMVKSKGDEEPMVQQEEEDRMKQSEDSEDKKTNTWYCKKNDGKRWHCRSIVNEPNTMCDYHLARSRSYYTPISGKVAGASATSSGLRKVSAIGKTALEKPSGSKRAPAGEGSSSKAAPAASRNSSKATSSVTVQASSQQRKRKRKSTDGSGGGDYYFYDLFGPFRGKDRTNRSRVVSSAVAEEKGLLQQDNNAIVVQEAKDKMVEYIDVDNLSSHSSITSGGGDKENDEDYVIGGAGKACAEKGKGKMAVEKMQCSKIAKKRIKEKSLKSLL